MIPQNPFQGALVRPVAAPVGLGLAPGRAGGGFEKDITDLSGLSQTAAALGQMMAQKSQEDFKEDFTLALSEAQSNPQLLSDLQVAVEAQRGGDEATKELQKKLRRLRKEGKVRGPETPGFYAGIEASLGIQAGKNKGDALTKFVLDRLNKFNPEDPLAPNPPTFDALQAEFEAQYKAPGNLPVGYYAADGFANAYGQDIATARNGYTKSTVEYEERRGRTQVIENAVDALVSGSLAGEKPVEQLGIELMNHIDNSADVLGLIPASEKRKVVQTIIETAAARASVAIEGGRNAQNALDLIEAAKEWEVPSSKRRLIEDDPDFFFKLEEEWTRKRDQDTTAENAQRELQIKTHISEWVSILNQNIAVAVKEGRTAEHGLEMTLEQLTSKMGDSAFFGDIDRTLRELGPQSLAVYDTTNPSELARWRKRVASDTEWTIDLLAAGKVSGLSTKDQAALLQDAMELAGLNASTSRNGAPAAFTAELEAEVTAGLNFIPAGAPGATKLAGQLDAIVEQASSEHRRLVAMVATGQVSAAEQAGRAAEIRRKATEEAEKLTAPVREERSALLNTFYVASENGDTTSGLPAVETLRTKGLVSEKEASEMRTALRRQAMFGQVFESPEWRVYLGAVEETVSPRDNRTTLSEALAADRIALETRDLRLQLAEWRKGGFSIDDITTALLPGYLAEKRQALAGEADKDVAEALNAEVAAGGNLQTYAAKEERADSFQTAVKAKILDPLKVGADVDVADVKRTLMAKGFSEDTRVDEILDDVYNQASPLFFVSGSRRRGLHAAARLAGDIAEGLEFADAPDKNQMVVDLLGMIPGALHYSHVLEGQIPVLEEQAYYNGITIKAASSIEQGQAAVEARTAFSGETSSPASKIISTIPVDSVTINPFKDSLFSSKEEIAEANRTGKLKPLMTLLGLPLSDASAKAFVDAQTNLLNFGS